MALYHICCQADLKNIKLVPVIPFPETGELILVCPRCRIIVDKKDDVKMIADLICSDPREKIDMGVEQDV
ncbi:MAG: hypothetical protein KGL39_32000 [Patescibacteria group bacterium]|nr:hypothetical protein [Patescibacteria group bacterium]